MNLQKLNNGRENYVEQYMIKVKNIKIKNIYYMLAYAYKALNEKGFESIEAEEFSNIHDLMAAILIKGVTNQIKRGLNKDYISQTESLGSLHGKIDITNSVKQQSFLRRQMVCHYDVFSENILLNQILKTTIYFLLRCGKVKQENRKMLRKLHLHFENIELLDPSQIKWSAIIYHRNNVIYKLLINICWLVLKGLLMAQTNGDYKLAQFLDDQEMHRLYEKFVLEYYKREYPQYSACASYIDWNLDDGVDTMLPAMKSDITLTNGLKTLIIDTKFYEHTTQTMFDKHTNISGNLYQIFTYVKNKDCTGSGNVSGVLLYAKTDEEIIPDNDYKMGGNHISVKTLDLGVDWCDIEEKLYSIVQVLETA